MILWLACTPLGLQNQCKQLDCDTGVQEERDESETTSPWPVVDTAADTNIEDGDTANPVDTDSEQVDTGESLDTEEPQGECTWEIYDRARDYASQYSERDGESWSGWCASLMWRFGEMPESSARPSAIGAYAESTILGMDARTAPSGAFHWWDIGVHGHVAVDLLGGGGTIFMASNYVLEDWGDAIGVTSVSKYTNATGATYLGWSMDYVNSEIADGGGAVCDGDHYHFHIGTVPVTNTVETGVPNTTFYMRMQVFGSLYNYTGPVDGMMGSYSWKGVQRGLAAMGYHVLESGIPDSDTYVAMQSISAQYGYVGPIDGVMGPNSYRYFSRFLNEEL